MSVFPTFGPYTVGLRPKCLRVWITAGLGESWSQNKHSPLTVPVSGPRGDSSELLMDDGRDAGAQDFDGS